MNEWAKWVFGERKEFKTGTKSGNVVCVEEYVWACVWVTDLVSMVSGIWILRCMLSLWKRKVVENYTVFD